MARQRLLGEAARTRLLGLPVDERDIVRHATLRPEDLTLVAQRRTEARFFAEWDAVARANSARPAPEMDGEGIVPFDHRTQRGTASPLIPDPIARMDISPDRAFPGFA